MIDSATSDWSPDGSKIALVSGSTIQILDSSTGEIQKVIPNPTSFVYVTLQDIRFSPNSKKIATSQHNKVYIFDLDTETTQIINVPVTYPDSISSLSWSPDGTRLVVSDTGHNLTVWEDVTGLSVLSLQNPDPNAVRLDDGGTYTYYDALVNWSPDGTKIVSSDKNIIYIWNAISGELLRTLKYVYVDQTPHTSNAYGLALSPSGNYVASASRDQNVVIRDSATGQVVDHFPAHFDSVYAITWKPDETKFATASKDGTIKIWNPKTVTDSATLDRVLSGHTYTVRSLAWNPNGSSLASASWDGTIKFWNPETGLETATVTDHTDFVNAVAWNHDGSKLASASSDQTIKLRNSDGTPITTLLGHTDSVLALAWSPDGTKLASGGADKTIRIWDSSTGLLLKTFEGSLGAVRAIVWTQDSTGVISGGDDEKVRGWIVATGEQKFSFKSELNAVFSLALNKDGQSVIVGNASGGVSSWKLEY